MVDRLHITEIGHRGDGLALVDGEQVFTPYTLPGETVDADPVPGHPDRRHLLRVIEPSPDRIEPFCPHFGICGGCATQHWALPPYRAWKQALVASALEAAGIETELGELIDAHGEGRRRAVLHARQGTKEIVEVGFSALRAHVIVPIDRCPVLAPSMKGAIEAAWQIAETLSPLGKPLDIHVTGTTNGLDIDVRGSGPLDAKRLSSLAKAATTGGIARITRHGEMVTQTQPPMLRMGKAKTVVDLFCGLGPFALRLAETCRVTAIDSDQPAIEALARAAQSTSGLKPVTTIRRDLFRGPLSAQELSAFDAIVFDPPRQGAETQAREIAKSKCRNVIAVSCNAATFARDAAILIGGGYRLERVSPVDQFKYTAHVEMVGHFVR